MSNSGPLPLHYEAQSPTPFSMFLIPPLSTFLKHKLPERAYLGEELLVGSLLLGRSRSRSGLDGLQLVLDRGVVGRQLVGLLEVLERGLLVLEADESKATAVQRLGAVGVLGALDVNGRGGRADGVVPGFKLNVEEGGVVVEGEAEGVEGGLGGLGLLLEIGLLVEIS